MNLRFIHPPPMCSLFVFYTSLSRALAPYALYILSRALAPYALYILSRALAIYALYILIPRVGCLCSIYSVLAPFLIFPLTYSATHLLSRVLYHTSSTWHPSSTWHTLSRIFYCSRTFSHLPSYILRHTSSLSCTLPHIFYLASIFYLAYFITHLLLLCHTSSPVSYTHLRAHETDS